MLGNSLSQTMGTDISDKVIKQMEYINRENSDKDEERFKKLDETIREYQRARAEVAVAEIETRKRHRHNRRAK